MKPMIQEEVNEERRSRGYWNWCYRVITIATIATNIIVMSNVKNIHIVQNKTGSIVIAVCCL